MEDIELEKYLENSPIPVSIEKTKDILFQMRNCVCKIISSNGKKGTGFFCRIPSRGQNQDLTVLFTNNHVLDETDIENNKTIEFLIKENTEKKIIKIDNLRKKFTSPELDITLIEIKPYLDDILDFLEVEEDVLNKNIDILESEYKKKSIYILHYHKGEEIQVSYGLINSISDQKINHNCNTDHGSSGSPILSLKSLKVIGIHFGTPKNYNYNIGTFIKVALNEINRHVNIYNGYNYNSIYYKSWNNVSSNFDNYANENKEMPNIVIDIGKDYCKAGFTGEEEPSVVFPTYVGYPKYNRKKKEYFVGCDALTRRYELNIKSPFKEGKIYDWDAMEKIFSHIFYDELKIEPKNHNVLIIDSHKNRKIKRKDLAEIMFETFNVKGLYIAPKDDLTLISYGKFGGIVIDSGEEETSISLLLDHIYNYCKVFPLGGKDITDNLVELMNEKGYKFSKEYHKDIIKDIKEKACYVALDFDDELKSVESFKYELPDGNQFSIKDERIKCTERFFDEIDFKKEFDFIYKNLLSSKRDFEIYLSGGNSMLKGFPERIELISKRIDYENYKVVRSPERKFSVWIGGIILASVSTFQDRFFTKKKYEMNPQEFYIADLIF